MADKKKKRGERKKVVGFRAPHDSSPVKDRSKRFRVPPMPKRVAFSPMAAPTCKTVYPVAWSETGWHRDGGSTEVCTVAVRLSDTTVHMATDTMTYAPNQREKIMERALTGKATGNDLRDVQRLRDQRHRKRERLYAKLHREFGNGVRA